MRSRRATSDINHSDRPFFTPLFPSSGSSRDAAISGGNLVTDPETSRPTATIAAQLFEDDHLLLEVDIPQGFALVLEVRSKGLEYVQIGL